MGSKPKPSTQSGSMDQTVDTTGWQEALSSVFNQASQQQAGSQQGQSTSTWAGQLNPYVDRMLQSATRALELTPGAVPGTTYEAPLYAGPNQMQRDAVQQLGGLAGTLGQGSQEVRDLALNTIAGKYLSPESNPFIRGAVDAAIRPVTQQLQRQVIPGISDASQAGGAYGGDRQGVLEGVAAADWAAKSGDIGANMYYQNYAAERDRQMQAPGLLSAANTMALAPAQALLMGGGLQQGWDQGALDADRQSYVNKQNDVWAGLGNYQNIIGSLLGFGTTNTTGNTTTTGTATGQQTGTNTVNSTGTQHTQGTSKGTYMAPQQSGLMGGLSGALGGASAGGMFGPWGAGIGAVLGGLGGLFS